MSLDCILSEYKTPVEYRSPRLLGPRQDGMVERTWHSDMWVLGSSSSCPHPPWGPSYQITDPAEFRWRLESCRWPLSCSGSSSPWLIWVPSPEPSVLLLPASELGMMASRWPNVHLFRAQQSGSLPAHSQGALLVEQSV